MSEVDPDKLDQLLADDDLTGVVDLAKLTEPEPQTRLDELKAALLDAHGLRSIKPPAPLIDGWLYQDSLAWLQGKPKHGKTFIALDIALSVALGLQWNGHEVTQGSVLYVVAEGASGLSRRIDAWELAHGQHASNIQFLPIAVQFGAIEDVQAVSQLVRRLDLALIVLDTQARITVGMEENANKDMGIFVERLEQIRLASRACILTVHHEPRKSENLRGATALEGAATSVLRSEKDGDVITLESRMQKDAPELDPITLSLRPIGQSVIPSPMGPLDLSRLSESESKCLTILRDLFGPDGARSTELQQTVEGKTGIKRSTFYYAINSLVSKGLVTRHSKGNSTIYIAKIEDAQSQLL